MSLKSTLVCLAAVVATLSAAPVAQGQMFKVYWKNLQLTSAKGVPNGDRHSYRMRGTFLVSDAPTTSWNDSIPLLNSGGTSFTTMREQVYMDVRAEWQADSGQATERITLTYEGGIQGTLESRFQSSVDPFLNRVQCVVTHSQIRCDVPNKQVTNANGVTTEVYPYFDLTGLVRGGQRPLTAGHVNLQQATHMSTNNTGTTPPPPPPASTTSLKVAGKWLSEAGRFDFEQSGTEILGTCLTRNNDVYLVKGRIVNDTLSLNLTESGKQRLVVENLRFDAARSELRGRYRKMGNHSGLSSPITLSRAIVHIPMTGTPSGSNQGTTSPQGNNGGNASISLAGTWQSNLGAVKLVQNGTNVTGELDFGNGVIAVMAGTLSGSTYQFTWGIGGQQLGSGSLTANQTGTALNGYYIDDRIGTPSNWSLNR